MEDDDWLGWDPKCRRHEVGEMAALRKSGIGWHVHFERVWANRVEGKVRV